MPRGTTGLRPARTVLEQKIRERKLTFEEFTEYAETFAREHQEPGTLSLRHLQRLVAGSRPDGTPLPPLRPATARLLERIFAVSADELLTFPAEPGLSGVGQLLRVAVSVVVREKRVLIVCRRDDEASGISWQFPAGIVKPGESPDVVAVRETLAETGIHSTVTRDLGNRLHPITKVHCEYRFCNYLTGEARNLDIVENVSVIWVELGELAHFIPMERMHEAAKQALRIGQTW